MGFKFNVSVKTQDGELQTLVFEKDGTDHETVLALQAINTMTHTPDSEYATVCNTIVSQAGHGAKITAIQGIRDNGTQSTPFNLTRLGVLQKEIQKPKYAAPPRPQKSPSLTSNVSVQDPEPSPYVDATTLEELPPSRPIKSPSLTSRVSVQEPEATHSEILAAASALPPVKSYTLKEAAAEIVATRKDILDPLNPHVQYDKFVLTIQDPALGTKSFEFSVTMKQSELSQRTGKVDISYKDKKGDPVKKDSELSTATIPLTREIKSAVDKEKQQGR